MNENSASLMISLNGFAKDMVFSLGDMKPGSLEYAFSERIRQMPPAYGILELEKATRFKRDL